MTVSKDKLTRIGHLGLVGLAGLLSVMSVAALASRHKGHKEITALLERYEVTEKTDEEQDKTQGETEKDKDANKQEKPKSVQQEQAERISNRHIFSPPEGKKGFPAKLLGVLGKQAFFEGADKGFEVGQSHKGGKIKQIGPDWVEVEFKGKTEKLYVFGKGGAEGGPPKPPGGPGVIKRPEGPRPTGGPRMRGNFELTPEMIEKFKAISAERRAEALKRMPAEMREKLEK